MRQPAAATPYGLTISPPNPAWLARETPEPVLDPERATLDAHHHLWERPGNRYLLDFESNLPVEKVGASYRTLRNAFKRIAAGACRDEKEALFAGTARRV